MSDHTDFDTDTYADVNDDASIGGFDASFVDVEGARTRCYEEGTDNEETLLLVHGGPWSATSSANRWVPVLEGLAEQYHVLALDRLACGMTDTPGADNAYEWEFESELRHVRDFLDAVGVESCHICGSSRGMGSSSWLAVEHPARIETVVCVNSHTLAPEVGDYGHRRAVLGQGIPSGAETREELEAQLQKQAEVWAYNPANAGSAEYFAAAAYMLTREKGQETARIMREGAKRRIEREGKFDVMDDIRARLSDGALAQPILLYWGRHDLTATFEQGLALYERLSQGNPNVRLHVVDRAGHLPFYDFPEEFVAEVTTFLGHWSGRQYTMEDVRPREYAEYWKSDDR